MANEMLLQSRPPNVIPFPDRMARSAAVRCDDEFDDEYDLDAHKHTDVSQPLKFGNLWNSMATMAKITLSGRGIKPGEVYCLELTGDGDMFLTQITEQGGVSLPRGAKFVTGITCNCSIERIALRLKEAAYHSA